MSLEQLERGLRVLHASEKVPQHNLEKKDSVLKQIELIRECDERQSEAWDCRSRRERHEPPEDMSTAAGHLGLYMRRMRARVPGVRSVPRLMSSVAV